MTQSKTEPIELKLDVPIGSTAVYEIKGKAETKSDGTNETITLSMVSNTEFLSRKNEIYSVKYFGEFVANNGKPQKFERKEFMTILGLSGSTVPFENPNSGTMTTSLLSKLPLWIPEKIYSSDQSSKEVDFDAQSIIDNMKKALSTETSLKLDVKAVGTLNSLSKIQKITAATVFFVSKCSRSFEITSEGHDEAVPMHLEHSCQYSIRRTDGLISNKDTKVVMMISDENNGYKITVQNKLELKELKPPPKRT